MRKREPAVWPLEAPHSWDLSPREAVEVQRRLAPLVEDRKPEGELRFVAGLDAAFSRDGESSLAGAVLWDSRRRCVVEESTAVVPLQMPYIPGLLSFREIPGLLEALRGLSRKPDALMCDGQGVAHPRRFGLAAHLGVIAGVPTVGCAKSRLCGTHEEPDTERGARVPLMDGKERIGTVLRTRAGVKPLFVSVGHRIDLPSAEELVLRCSGGYRLPEPIRRAHQLVGRLKRGG